MWRLSLDDTVTRERSGLDYRSVIPVVAVVFVDLLGLTIIIPLLPLYATSFGAEPLTVGFLGAMYPLTQFIGAPVLGRLSDYYGRKPVLLVSQVGTFLGFLLLGVAHNIWLLFISRIIDGFSGGNFSTAQAMIADATDEKTRTQGLGLVGAAFGLGFVIGPVIAFASLALSGANFHVPAFVAAGFSLISILLTTFMLKETVGRAAGRTAPKGFSFGSLLKALRHPLVGTLLALVFLQQLAFGGLQQLITLFNLVQLGMTATSNAILFVFIGCIIILVQGVLIGPLSRKYGEPRLIRVGLALLTIAFVLIATTPAVTVPWYSKSVATAELGVQKTLPGRTPPTHNLQVTLPEDGHSGWWGLSWLFAAMLPAAWGGAMLGPSINSLITQRVEVIERGGILGVSAALLSAGNAVAPVIGGALFQAGGPTAPFWAWAILLATIYLAARTRVR
jgi:MFS transporter, DHA1 family, tetracycline resistance protein